MFEKSVQVPPAADGGRRVPASKGEATARAQASYVITNQISVFGVCYFLKSKQYWIFAQQNILKMKKKFEKVK
jgi:hypothetical protein